MRAQSKDGKLFHVGRWKAEPLSGLDLESVCECEPFSALWVIRFLASMGENGGGNITDCFYCQHAVIELTWGPKYNDGGGEIW